MSESERLFWDERYGTAGRLVTEPSLFVVDAAARHAPDPGRALDVAGGTGRHALWLSGRGWLVTLIDVSRTGLEIAQADAMQVGADISTVLTDLDTDPLPRGPWNLMVVHHYLNRPLFPALIASMAAGGVLLFAQPTIENLTRHDRPGPAYSLQPGEARVLVAGLEVVSYFEDWTAEGRHEAQVAARRPE